MTISFDDLVKKKQELDAIIKAEGEQALKTAFADLFEQHSELRSLGWVQYIPGFNDGDPCEFTLGELHVRLAGDVDEQEDEEDYGEEFYGNGWKQLYDLYEYVDDGPAVVTQQEQYDYKTRQYVVKPHTYQPRRKQWINDLGPVLDKLNSDLQHNSEILEGVFGSYAKVTVNRDKVTVDDYDAPY